MTISELNKTDHKDNIAIVVIGYNRIGPMDRLLKSLLRANYPADCNVPLVISIDCSGNEELYRYAQDFKWPFGDKYVNIQQERLGLKKHIFKCIALSEFFKAVVVLEDDLFISPYFYSFVENAVDKYGEDPRIAEIALYKNESNGYAFFPFIPIEDGKDVFLWQDICTWGEVFTYSMWKRFKDWYDSECTDDIIENADMPYEIKTWARAWSKPYDAFVVNTGSYIVYPKIPLTTNFGEAGEHSDDAAASMVQVSILLGEKSYSMPDVEELSHYDLFCNNEAMYNWLDIDRHDICLDIYGMGRNAEGKRYILSPKVLPYNAVRHFALNSKPIETNILHNIEGNGLFLYDTQQPVSKKEKRKYPFAFLSYYLNIYNTHDIWQYAFKTFSKALKTKLHL